MNQICNTRQMTVMLVALVIILVSSLNGANAFTVTARHPSKYMSTTTAPPREKTGTETQKTTKPGWKNPEAPLAPAARGPLEYLIDDTSISRKVDDPFHILMLGKTFDQPRVTLPYVTGTLSYVLNMPEDDAKEHAFFAKDEGISCLGTWTHEECLTLGAKLQVRDVICRVVPAVEGGGQGWQAKDASDSWDVPSFSDFQ
mmetsp:Transcript_23769/g.34670  ORF Transcript_23769/g.34670 Transcript_23769/m.34670 type:complete len:200 (-) Transcript_23769:360-959(-)|eukprot:CAMPEP_0195521814 /NCGR_PEP_ID=MMETSP0794_2-20130614/19414_1 /TAXON_ID=515487 /ORGANISM="Stephanopyxis turris, Strain CCMP 815" /LENGTH=199 /DNA_ID=CAMNT_0040651435 /DNA_START=81 /DNA_END=680 /DNA_ORIENTATION=+